MNTYTRPCMTPMETDLLLSPLFLALANDQDDCLLVCDAHGKVIHAGAGKTFAEPPVLRGENIRDRLQLPVNTFTDLGTNILGQFREQPCDIRVQRVDIHPEQALYLCRVRPLSGALSWQNWLESLPAPIAVRDRNGYFLWANTLFIRRFAGNGACIAGRHIRSVLCAEDADKTLAADHYVLETGRSTLFEYTCSDRQCAEGHYLVLQGPCRLPGQDAGIISVVEEKEKLRMEMPSFQETEIRYQRLARHLMAQLDNHNAALARDLHDVLGQTLIGIKLAIHNAMGRQDVPPSLAEAMQYWMVLLDESITFIRSFTSGLHPRHLQEFGLKRTLRTWLEQSRLHSDIAFDIRIDEELPKLNADVKNACLRIAQEAVTNSLRHASATRVQVDLHHRNGYLTLNIIDDGNGFCAQEAREHQAGLGLVSMSERAHLSGGKLNITSNPGTGTTITAIWPIT